MSTVKKYALLSVSNKTGIVDFARGLHEAGIILLSTGGTAKVIGGAGVPVTDVATIVGEPLLGERVKTLSREIAAGELALPKDIGELEKRGIPWIELACVNLYPLEEEIAKEEATLASVIENTDIGGPTMLRSGAKGQRIVVCDPADYDTVLERIKSGTDDDIAWREELAAKAEALVANYALASARYRGKGAYDGIVGTRSQVLKYGENPQQKYAATFTTKAGASDPFAVHNFKQIEGTAPSYVNITDLDCLVETLTRTAAAFDLNTGRVPHMMFAAKHGNCCGAAIGDNPYTITNRVVSGDREAISGAFVICTFEVDAGVADVLLTHLMEKGQRRIFDGVVAPSFTEEAIDKLSRKTGKCRLFVNPELVKLGRTSVDMSRRIRYVRGGFTIQDSNPFIFQVKAEWKLTFDEVDDLLLAQGIGSTGNSNSIVLVKNGMLIGSGMGQRSRVMAGKFALLYADTYDHNVAGALAYSDSFCPFIDGPELLAKAGVTKIFATSGSIRDKEVLERMHELGVKFMTLPDAEARGFAKH